MKKQLLFVMDSLPLGGISKSFLSLLSCLDFERYDVDLLLFRKEGFFLDRLPPFINLLPAAIRPELLEPNPRYFFRNIKSLPFKDFFKWLSLFIRCAFGRLFGGLSGHLRQYDKTAAALAQPLSKKYDAAIAYQGSKCIYYVVDKVCADVKIGYIHGDYGNYDGMFYHYDKRYYPKLDSIVTVSQACAEIAAKKFPLLKSKIKVIENIISPSALGSMAEQEKAFSDSFSGIRIVTISRLDVYTKGLDLACEACLLLKKAGFPIRWYLVGSGMQKYIIKNLITSYHIEDTMILTGAKANPYPYLKECDIYVQPSRSEGHSIAIEEAKALCRPVVAAEFQTVYNQISDGINGLIVKQNAHALFRGIAQMIEHPELRKTLRKNLENTYKGNEAEIYKFYDLLKKHDKESLSIDLNN